jgi:SAM-dependent methyltransferase
VTTAAFSASGVLAPDAEAAAIFDAALVAGGQTPLTLRTRTWARPLPLARWCGGADQADSAVLDRYVADLPGNARVLDFGCGPGRHTEHLTFAGLQTLGVDNSPTAVALTRRRGSSAVRADALGPLPGGSHGWDGVVLLDGNIGIGGDPLLLLCRVRDLLGPQGSVLVELDGSGCSDRCRAVLDDGARTSRPFPWALLSRGAELDAALCAADLRQTDSWTAAGATFVILRAGHRA